MDLEGWVMDMGRRPLERASATRCHVGEWLLGSAWPQLYLDPGSLAMTVQKAVTFQGPWPFLLFAD